jgi:hypothetical protein
MIIKIKIIIKVGSGLFLKNWYDDVVKLCCECILFHFRKLSHNWNFSQNISGRHKFFELIFNQLDCVDFPRFTMLSLTDFSKSARSKMSKNSIIIFDSHPDWIKLECCFFSVLVMAALHIIIWNLRFLIHNLSNLFYIVMTKIKLFFN